jgi:hypothetical protein
VWDGRANSGTIVAGAGTQLEGLSLRLYDPESRRLSIYWANSGSAAIGPPMIGRFTDGRGEFHNRESFRGAEVDVRFVFSAITPASFTFEQAFSNDGGRTWEPNWIATFVRGTPG